MWKILHLLIKYMFESECSHFILFLLIIDLFKTNYLKCDNFIKNFYLLN
jgi:hypothetical protein